MHLFLMLNTQFILQRTNNYAANKQIWSHLHINCQFKKKKKRFNQFVSTSEWGLLELKKTGDSNRPKEKHFTINKWKENNFPVVRLGL